MADLFSSFPKVSLCSMAETEVRGGLRRGLRQTGSPSSGQHTVSASCAGLKVKTAHYLLRSSLKTLGALGANGNFNVFLSLTQKKKGVHLGSFKDPTWSCDQTHTLCSRWLHWKIKKKKNKLVNSLIFCQCLRKINFLFILWVNQKRVCFKYRSVILCDPSFHDYFSKYC